MGGKIEIGDIFEIKGARCVVSQLPMKNSQGVFEVQKFIGDKFEGTSYLSTKIYEYKFIGNIHKL